MTSNLNYKYTDIKSINSCNISFLIETYMNNIFDMSINFYVIEQLMTSNTFLRPAEPFEDHPGRGGQKNIPLKDLTRFIR